MRETVFLRQNAERWKEFEQLLARPKNANPDQLADLFIQLTDDLSYARTFYPKSKATLYLNNLAAKVHGAIYRNRRENRSRFITFWTEELPEVVWRSRREIFYSFLIFALSIAIGAFSAANDPGFLRVILGDGYVDMTLENISKGDPMGVYKQHEEMGMFVGITANNIGVAFRAFAMGIALSAGTAYIIFTNGVMVGAFQYFFFEQGLFIASSLSIWLHGTFELSAIVLAGGAGLVMGNSILFPRTYSRSQSFMRGAKQGLKLVIGLVPVFIVAGFIESFLTRHSEMPAALSALIILLSLACVVWYFVIYPYKIYRRSLDGILAAA